MRTVTVFRRRNTLMLSPQPDAERIVLELREDVQLRRTVLSGALFYRGASPYGFGFERALAEGWCRIVEASRAV